MSLKLTIFHQFVSKNIRLISFLITNLLYFYSFNFFNDQFKLLFAFSLVIICLNFLFTKNFFYSLLVTFISSVFYYLPAKLFSVELLTRYEQTSELFREGLTGQFGLNISDLLAFALLIFFSREILKERGNIFGTEKKIWFIGISWFFYSLWNSFNSLYNSWFPVFSLTLSLQSFKIVIFLFSLHYLFFKNKKMIGNLLLFLFSINIFQCLLGVWQTLTFSNNVEFAGGYAIPEENNFLIRPYGVVGYANPHALVITILYAITGQFVLKTNKKLFYFYSLLVLINIILTQTRSIWIAWFLFSVFYLMSYKKTVIRWAKQNVNSRGLFYFFSFVFLSFPLAYSRIKLSYLFFTLEGGGWFRLKMIKEAFLTYVLNPLFGYGVGTIVPVVQRIFPNGYIRDFPFPVHLVFLQILLESGLVGFIFFIIPFVIYFIVMIRKYGFFLRKYYLLGFISILCYYCFQPSNINMLEIYLFAALIIISFESMQKQKYAIPFK